MTEWWTTRSMAAAVAIGLAKMCSHWEKTRLEAMPGLMILANDRAPEHGGSLRWFRSRSHRTW